MDLAWMAWTTPTALFFGAIALGLATMTVLELRWPTVARRGLLGIVTTRGDRFFIGLLTSGWLHLAWLGLVPLSMWGASVLAALWLVALLRWG